MSDCHCVLDPAVEGKLLYQDAPIEPVFPDHIHLGGLYNSIYPYDWLKITGARSFKLEIKGLIRDVRISVLLHSPGIQTQTIKQLDRTTSDDAIVVVIDDLSPSPGQRLTCQIESTAPINLQSVSWTAISEPTRVVKLGIVICTYNNEARLKENINALVSSEVWNIKNPVIVLINNGEIKDDSWFPEERFYKFDQENLGGSGGFGRGIYEVVYGKVKDLGLTHILLMDDDVSFHPEVISRAIAFHQKSTEPVAIGASMLKLEDPTWLHEAGANLNSNRRIGTSTDIPVGYLEETGALDYLGRGKEYDYNAWWFCSFPSDAARRVGLPLPLFIHGDDIEYGIRLNLGGYPVYCPGGISLWHESFENKHLTWIRYFDFRNALIRLTLSFDNSPKILIHQLKNLFKRSLIRNDYGSCIMTIKAFEDFCKGPEILFKKNFPAYINELTELYHSYSYAEITGRYRFSGSAMRCQKKRRIKQMFKYITTNFHSVPLPSFRHYETNNTRFAWTDVPCLADITVNLRNGTRVHYERDLIKCKTLRKRLRTSLRKHRPNLASIQEAWRKKQEAFHSESFWKEYCGS